MPCINGQLVLDDHDAMEVRTPLGLVRISTLRGWDRRTPPLTISSWNKETVTVEADVDRAGRIGQHGFATIPAEKRKS